MKINALKRCILLYALMFNAVLFAQIGSGPSSTASNEDDVALESFDAAPTETPIDSKLVLLAITGVCFGYFYYTKNRKAQTS